MIVVDQISVKGEIGRETDGAALGLYARRLLLFAPEPQGLRTGDG